MSKKSGRKNSRQHNFRVVARGVRRAEPDYSRLVQAALDHYLAVTRAEQAERPSSSTEGNAS